MLAKKEIQQDFKEMYELLLEYDYKSKISNDSIKDYLKSIHKASYIFCVWKIHFQKKEFDYPYLDEIASTFVQIIYTTIYCDIKILYMLYRNIIDNFIKICKIKIDIPPTTQYTLQIFEEILQTEEIKQNKIMDDSFRKILNLYKKSCGYVHSTGDKFMSFNQGVKNYNSDNFEELSKNIIEFYDLIKNINYIFIFMFTDIYEKHFAPEEKQIIHYFCNRDVLRNIFTYKYGVEY